MNTLYRFILLALASLAFAAPSAVAAGDPSCDVTAKSSAELRALLATPTGDQYDACPDVSEEAEAELGRREDVNEVAGTRDRNTPSAGDVAGTKDVADDTVEVSGTNLPFTGAEMGTFAVLGACLVLTGLVLRRGGSSRRTL